MNDDGDMCATRPERAAFAHCPTPVVEWGNSGLSGLGTGSMAMADGSLMISHL